MSARQSNSQQFVEAIIGYCFFRGLSWQVYKHCCLTWMEH